MYCPRCGSPNPETTKFCRQCGLPLNQVAGYVSSGGTSPLAKPSTPSPVAKITEGMTPRQKLILTILLFIFSPAIFAVIGDAIPFLNWFTPLAGILMVPGIFWAVFRYKAEKRSLERQQAYSPPPGYQPQLQRNPMAPPAQISPPHTNPISAMPGSVVEDETKKLPINNQ